MNLHIFKQNLLNRILSKQIKFNTLYLKIKNHPNILNDINSYCSFLNKDATLFQKFYHWIYEINEIPKCKICDKPLNFIKFSTPYKLNCSKECYDKYKKSIEYQEKIKQTNLKKYGTERPLQSKEIQEKTKQTNLKKYGTENIFQSKIFKEKTKQTNLERLGVQYPTQSKEVINKMKKTNLEKYGTELPMQSKIIQEKAKQTNLERLGVEYPAQSKVALEKMSKSIIKNRFLKFKTKIDQTNYNFIKNEEHNVTLKCPTCNNEFIEEWTFLSRRLYYNSDLCTNCNPIGSRNGEENIFKEFISSLNIEFIENDRKLLNNKELDVYVPSKNIAFEFNGLYWHSAEFKEKNYHKNKKQLALESDINLIHIWEDDWNYKQDIVKSRIKNIFGLNKKIYARKCQIKEVDIKIAKEFLNHNHIQGHVISKTYIGLYYKEELVALMSFGKRNNKLELLRFANKIYTNVIGAFSKLLKYYIKTYNILEIYSYGDLDWINPNNNVYLKNNFIFEKFINPGYSWFKRDMRESRMKYQKYKLIKEGYDSNMTEDEIMIARGYRKIYNSGNILYKFNR